MIYKKLLEKKKTGFFEFVENKIFGLSNTDGYLKLAEFDNNYEIIWQTKDNKVNNFIVFRNNLIYTKYKTKTVSINYKNYSTNYEVDKPIYILQDSCDEKFYYGFDEKGFFKLDLQNGKFVSRFLKENLNGWVKLIDDFLVYRPFLTGTVMFLNKNNFSIVWQKDLSEITSYNDWDGDHKGEISNVYKYNNQLIVLSGNCVLALAIDTGEILWKLSYKGFTPYTLHIIDNKGYFAKGAFYSVIDLEKGEKILDTMIDNIFNREKNYQNNYAMVGSDITYHKGKIYFSDKQNGKYYLFCLNPEIGIIEDYMYLEDIDSNLAPPKFHKGKMFLLDSKSTLHIFETQQNTLET